MCKILLAMLLGCFLPRWGAVVFSCSLGVLNITSFEEISVKLWLVCPRHYASPRIRVVHLLDRKTLPLESHIIISVGHPYHLWELALSCTTITDAAWDRWWCETARAHACDSIIAEASDPNVLLLTIGSLIVPFFNSFYLDIYFSLLYHFFFRFIVFVFVFLNLLLHFLVLVDQKPKHLVELLVW